MAITLRLLSCNTVNYQILFDIWHLSCVFLQKLKSQNELTTKYGIPTKRRKWENHFLFCSCLFALFYFVFSCCCTVFVHRVRQYVWVKNRTVYTTTIETANNHAYLHKLSQYIKSFIEGDNLGKMFCHLYLIDVFCVQTWRCVQVHVDISSAEPPDPGALHAQSAWSLLFYTHSG